MAKHISYVTAEKLYQTVKNRDENNCPQLFHNVWLEQFDDCFAIRYGSLVVVRIYPDGTFTCDSHGQRTVALKYAITRFAPFPTGQNIATGPDGKWYVARYIPIYGPSKNKKNVTGSNGAVKILEAPFYDGMMFTYNVKLYTNQNYVSREY